MDEEKESQNEGAPSSSEEQNSSSKKQGSQTPPAPPEKPSSSQEEPKESNKKPEPELIVPQQNKQGEKVSDDINSSPAQRRNETQQKAPSRPNKITPEPKNSEERIPQQKIPKKPTQTPEDEQNEAPQKKSTLSAIRTYKGDVSQVVKKGSSLSSMIIAEKKKKEKQEPSEEPSSSKADRIKKIVLITLGALLVIGGAGLVVFLLPEKSSPSESEGVDRSRDIIFIEKAKKIILTKQNTPELIEKVSQEIETASLPINTVQHTYLVKRETRYQKGRVEGEVRESALTFEELLSFLSANAPSQLTRAVDPAFVFGIHTFTKNNPFILLRVTSYDNAFSGMLSWERTLLQDIAPLFSISQEKQLLAPGAFKDVVIDNQDVRVLADREGEVVLLYSFLNRETLLITTHEVTFDEILERLRR